MPGPQRECLQSGKTSWRLWLAEMSRNGRRGSSTTPLCIPFGKEVGNIEERWDATSLLSHFAPCLLSFFTPLFSLLLFSFPPLLGRRERSWLLSVMCHHLAGLRVGNRVGHKEPNHCLCVFVCNLAFTKPSLRRQAAWFIYLIII